MRPTNETTFPLARGLRTDAGFTLLEVVFALAFLTTGLLFVGGGLQSASQTSREIQEDLRVLSKAQDIIDLVSLQRFGDATDPSPTGAQLSELFDDDEVPGDITLHQASRWPVASDGWVFQLAGFPVSGTWRVKIDNDLTGPQEYSTDPALVLADDAARGTLELTQTIFAIRVFFNDRLILTTFRARG